MYGWIVMSGIVCLYNYFYLGFFCGIMVNIVFCLDFILMLKNFWWWFDCVFDEELFYYSGLICFLEVIKSGCILVIDYYVFLVYIGGLFFILCDVFLKVGLCVMICFEIIDCNNGIKELQEGVEENICFVCLIDEVKKVISELYLVEVYIGVYVLFIVLDVGLEMLCEVVKVIGCGLYIYVVEDFYDVFYSYYWYGKDLLV